MNEDPSDAQRSPEDISTAPAPGVPELDESLPRRRVAERANPENLRSPLGRMRKFLSRVGPKSPKLPASEQKIHASGGGVAIGQVSGDIYVYNSSDEAASLELARNLFRSSIRDRDRFISQFLGQALRQAGTTFALSITFMSIGGALVLFAGVMALATAQTSPATNYLLLASGLGGLIVGASGAAFARRADKSRKHLAEQADRMHAQLLDERKFVQAGELLTGVKDPTLNDQARIALALKLLGAEPPPQNGPPTGPANDGNRNRSQPIDDARI